MTVSVHALTETAPTNTDELRQWLDLDPQTAHRGLFDDPAIAVTEVSPARMVEGTANAVVCTMATATIRTDAGTFALTAHAFYRFALDGRCLLSVAGHTIDTAAISAHERSLMQVADNITIGFTP
jgi:hypothetical protein